MSLLKSHGHKAEGIGEMKGGEKISYKQAGVWTFLSVSTGCHKSYNPT